MSRVRNADEFLIRFREIRARYESDFQPRIAKIRGRYAESPVGLPPAIDESLEAHARTYVVNCLLAALNWRLNASPEENLPTLIPEAPVRSEGRNTVRFLDYLGLEHDTTKPLLIVETKRPRSPLPQLAVSSEETYPAVLSRGLRGEPLKDAWSKWLNDARDYVRSVHDRSGHPPRRVVLTNGEWLIIFLDPANAFLDGGSRSAASIVVFENRDEIDGHSAEIFLHLEHGFVLGKTSELAPGDLPFQHGAETTNRVMHGLRLRYIEQPQVFHGKSPVIKVAPILFVRTRLGLWLRISSPPREHELPHETNRLITHLREVESAAQNLLKQVNRQLGATLRPAPLSDHYDDSDAFDDLRGVRELQSTPDQFYVVTGDKTHYLLPKPSVFNCPHHDWTRSHKEGAACGAAPVMARSIQPRSFFKSQEGHHCAHREVATSKSNPITATNRERCGPRSGRDGQAFCEIFHFEQHLCCRTCVFEDVCTKADTFRLPCQPTRLYKAYVRPLLSRWAMSWSA